MNKTQNNKHKSKAVSDSKTAKATIKSLIVDLASKDGVVRVKTLSNENDWVRWEEQPRL
jgi:hypothetical protein